MFDEITFNRRRDDTHPAPRANGVYHLPPDFTDAAGNAGADDRVVALWAERNRLAAEADEADAAYDQARTDEIDERVLAIDLTICRTLATTLPGVLAQMHLLAMMRKAFVPDDDDEFLSVNIRAAIVALIEREGHQS